MKWEERVAKKVIAQLIGDAVSDYGDAANVVGVMQLATKDKDRLVAALKRIKKRFDKDADLPERRVEWRGVIES